MDYEFKLPDIGEGLVEGEIVKWFVKPGDSIQEHQPLAAVLTDKAEVEVPSPRSGKIVKLFGKPGEKIKVHSPLAIIAVGAEGAGNGKPSKAEPRSAPAKAEQQGNGGAARAQQQPSKAAVAVESRPAASGGYVFNLPDIGEGLVEGELVRWMVQEGAKVNEHEPIAAVLTDKAEVEIPSPKTGTIAKLHAKPGQKVRVHSPLVTYSGVEGGSTPAAPGSEAARGAARAPDAPARQTGSRPTGRETDVLATPMVRKLAKERGIDLSRVPGSGPDGRVLESDLKAFQPGAARPAAPARTFDNSEANATPAVKHLANELGVNLATVKGTGPGGRISELDVRGAAPARPASKPGSAAPAAAPSAPATAPSPTWQSGYPPVSIKREPGDEAKPFAGIRRKIAEKMQQSRRTVAHVTHMDECDFTAVLELREKMKKEAEKKKVKLTFLPFIIRALIKTLDEFPAFNSALDEAANEIVLRRSRNVGIAVAAPQGLVVPNIKGAEKKDLWALASEIAALADKVRSGKIDVPSLQGGTITITNIGPIGGLFATPIVNHPEVAILGLMKLMKRPVVRDDKVVVRDMMNLVLSFDHRVVDGADAANFMNTLIKHLENPRTLV